MQTPANLSGLHLVLTAQCNLRCRYCYQDAKRERRMSDATARAAVDVVLTSDSMEVTLSFTGGEPLLEFSTLRDVVRYASRATPAEKTIRYRLFTNGTRLDDVVLGFLIDHDFEIQLSFDGVPAAQSERAAGTHALLDALLDRIRERDRAFYANNLRVALTLVPPTMVSLPRSVEYFLGKGVQSLAIAPGCSPAYDWLPSDIERLDASVGEAADVALAHLESTGEMPVALFRSSVRSNRGGRRDLPMCGGPLATEPVVDVDGMLYGCTALTPSYRRPWSPFLAERVEPLTIGSIHDPDLTTRLEAYRRLARCTDIFSNKERKYSSYGRCVDCACINSCTVCPPTIGLAESANDPERVPDFVCAFNRIVEKHRRRFPSTVLRDLTRYWSDLLERLR